MHKFILTAGLLAAISTPALASAQQTCEQHRNTRTGATVAGGVAGAILGAVIAGKGDDAKGALIGGAGGALIGNRIAKAGKDDCINAYGYYDRGGAWHANEGQASAQTGYYDRDGNWVDGVPRGYYDGNGRWIAANVAAERAGYRDSHGHYVPATVNGYYDADNAYRSGTVSGYYRDGRWVAGETTGRYDRDGRWIEGQAAARRDANGNWVYDPQPGYYNTSGRWIAGETRGYYDARGTWISTSAIPGRAVVADSLQGHDIRSREARITQRIARGYQDGSLTRSEYYQAGRELHSIQRYRVSVTNRRGYLRPGYEAVIQARLDRLSDMIRLNRQDARAY